MKNTDWKILLSAITYTLLFYKQESGLNYLIFSVLMVSLTLIQKPKNLKNISWLMLAFGAIFSSFFIYKYGTPLPIVANYVSLIFLAGITFKTDSSLLISGFNSLVAYIIAIPLFIINVFKTTFSKNKENKEKTKKTFVKKLLLLIFPLFVVLVFFVLYRDSNPLFLKVTEAINLDWLSFPLVKFFLSALLLMYAFFVQNILKPINNLDENAKESIPFLDEEAHSKSFFSKLMSLESETFIATTLLVLLNILIALLNGIDINYLWLKADLPQGLVFSDYLHSGTFTLIVSIIFAIIIIIYFFRGIFNFNKHGKWLKILGFMWVFQNIIMIISAMLRNQLYIADYGMTHKRIGVYVFLLLAIIGLVATLVKIGFKKNTVFLIRKNAWAFYAVLIISSLVNWDMLITKHNIKLANKKYIVDLDKNYLANLSHVNTYALALQDSSKTPYEIYYNSNTDYWSKDPLQEKIQELLDYEKRANWQESCLNKNINIQKLKELNSMGKIAKLDLYSMYLNDITEYKTLSNIKGLNANNNNFKDNLKGLETYQNLEVLNLDNNYISKLDSLPKLQKLTHLNLKRNNITDFSELGNQTPNITHLDISETQTELNEADFPSLAKLENINLSQTNTTSWLFLEKQTQLKEITFRKNSTYDISIPKLENLRKLDVSNSKLLYSNNVPFLDSLSVCINLNDLNLNNCGILTTYYLINHYKQKALFENLKKLQLSNNTLNNNIQELAYFNKLEYLDLSSNNTSKIDGIETITTLKELHLAGNLIKDITLIKHLENLKVLNLSSNNIIHVENLKSLDSLEKLNLANNKVIHIDSLFSLKGLKSLSISGNKIKDISGLEEMKSLTHLSIGENPIKDYDVLFKMKHLKYLSVGNLDLKIIEELKKQLPKTEIDYFSNNLNKPIVYNNNKRTSYIEKF